MPKLLLTLISSFYLLQCPAQKNYGVSQDYYIYQNNNSSIVPLIYYETKNSWYAAARYNYEASEALSLQFGKNFSKQGKLCYSITPLAGILTGNYKGFSMAAQAEIEVGKFNFFTEPEYCFQFKNQTENFFYNWAEISIQPSKTFYTGLALQTMSRSNISLTNELGLLFGVSLKNFEIPLYFFRAPSTNYFVTGIHWRLEK
ncbi:MAG TPA: hypothetical protein VNT20_03555 [Flavisolibacter sp.]|nr:hypothetical protein [Flavisolibacter sp.]